jgi:hypothetical protein
MTRGRKREVEESVDATEEEERYVEDQGPIQHETEDIWGRIVSFFPLSVQSYRLVTFGFVQIMTSGLHRLFACDAAYL